MAPSEPSRALANWLWKERNKRRWTIAEMARKLREAADRAAMPGTPQAHVLMSYVSRWELGHVSVSPRYRVLICAAFGIQPEVFGPRGLKKPAAARLDIVILRKHPPGTGAGKACQFNKFCPTLAKFIVQPADARKSPQYFCGRDLTRAITELMGQTDTTVGIQRIVWPDQGGPIGPDAQPLWQPLAPAAPTRETHTVIVRPNPIPDHASGG